MQAINIAKENNIPKNFLDVILSDLRRAGVVSVRKDLAGVTC